MMSVFTQVGSSEIHAHRAVLACASPYFFELFTSEDERKTAHEGKVRGVLLILIL